MFRFIYQATLFAALLFCYPHELSAEKAACIPLERVCKPPYNLGAILRRDPLFVDDFLTLHCLLRMAEPCSVFEIGTCTGEGTQIIKNAVGESVVYSLELPLGQSSYDLTEVGEMCKLSYIQIFGDSLTLHYPDFYPIDAWFIDGAHDYVHVFHETKQALLSNPSLIAWHDADIAEVLQAIEDGLGASDYVLFRVDNTRIAFAIPSTSHLMDLMND